MEFTAVEQGKCSAIVTEAAGRLFERTEEAVAAAWTRGVLELLSYAKAPVTSTMLEAEAESIEMAQRIVASLLQARMQQRLDELDEGSWGTCRCPTCGGATESKGRRPRSWKGLGGTMTLRGRYSHCAACKTGSAPALATVGLGAGDFTPRFEEVVTMLATTVPHGMAVKLADELLSVKVSEKAVQSIVEVRARCVAQQLQGDAEALAPFDPLGLPVPEQKRPADATSTIAEVAYLEMDGVVPMTREELVGRELSEADRRKQRRAKKAGARGGRGKKYRLVGREVKNAVLYTDAACLTESPSRRFIAKKHYVSHLGDWRQFAALLWVELLRQNFDRAKLLVLLSDGAEWIRSLSQWLPIPVLLILDLYHVKHRIWEVANALHGEHSARARRWAETQCARIEAGLAKQTIQSLRFLKPTGHDAQPLVDALAEYLGNNLDRMDYPRYRAMGLRLGSGAVESANYHVTGARLKLQGMRWSEQGAREMAYLRADLFNHRWAQRTREILAS